ncbi:unnamed protein product, partial [Rotaria socialis]
SPAQATPTISLSTLEAQATTVPIISQAESELRHANDNEGN